MDVPMDALQQNAMAFIIIIFLSIWCSYLLAAPNLITFVLAG
jgi:hypothetical protein